MTAVLQCMYRPPVGQQPSYPQNTLCVQDLKAGSANKLHVLARVAAVHPEQRSRQGAAVLKQRMVLLGPVPAEGQQGDAAALSLYSAALQRRHLLPPLLLSLAPAILTAAHRRDACAGAQEAGTMFPLWLQGRQCGLAGLLAPEDMLLLSCLRRSEQGESGPFLQVGAPWGCRALAARPGSVATPHAVQGQP